MFGAVRPRGNGGAGNDWNEASTTKRDDYAPYQSHSYAERNPALVAKAKELSAQRPRVSLREISAELAKPTDKQGKIGRGLTLNGLPFSASAVKSMLLS